MTKKILVVEDDKTTRFMMSEFLYALGYDYVLVENGGACLAKLMTEPESVSMILMDIHMPSLTGLEATAWIRDSESDPPRTIPIVAVTADTTYHDVDKIRSFGMDSVLPKPVRIEDLEGIISKLAA